MYLAWGLTISVRKYEFSEIEDIWYFCPSFESLEYPELDLRQAVNSPVYFSMKFKDYSSFLDEHGTIVFRSVELSNDAHY